MRRLFSVLFILVVSQVNAQHIISLTNNHANGIENFSQVAPGDTVYIESGEREQLLFSNFHGTGSLPIIFAVSDMSEAVRITSEESYGISFRNCSFIKLSGWKGEKEKYGIQITNITHDSGVGIGVSDNTTDIEICYVEIAQVGFAGILAKTDPNCTSIETRRGGFVQRNTKIHNCFIHDTGGEGIYVGHTSFKGIVLEDCGFVLPTILEGVEIYRNRIERSAWDGIQVTSAIADCKIYENDLIDCCTLQNPIHMGGILIGGGTLADCYNNRIIDCLGTGILVFGDGGTRVYNNLILRPGRKYAPGDPQKRQHGIYLDDKTDVTNSFFGIYSNTIVQPKSDCIRIAGNVDFDIRVYNNFLLDPGSWIVYENDNTDRTGFDSFVFIDGDPDRVKNEFNPNLRSLVYPGFVNVDEDDFHLGADSPYIDAGRDLSDQSGVALDLDNKKRPFGARYDIGAYEYGDASWIWSHKQAESVVKAVYQPSGDQQGILRLNFILPGFYNYQLLGITGRILKQGKLVISGEEEKLIPISSVSPGIYVLQIQSEFHQQAEKFVIY